MTENARKWHVVKAYMIVEKILKCTLDKTNVPRYDDEPTL